MIHRVVIPDAQVPLALLKRVPERVLDELSLVEGATVDKLILPIHFDGNAPKHIVQIKFYLDVDVNVGVHVLDPKVRNQFGMLTVGELRFGLHSTLGTTSSA